MNVYNFFPSYLSEFIFLGLWMQSLQQFSLASFSDQPPKHWWLGRLVENIYEGWSKGCQWWLKWGLNMKDKVWDKCDFDYSIKRYFHSTSIGILDNLTILRFFGIGERLLKLFSIHLFQDIFLLREIFSVLTSDTGNKMVLVLAHSFVQP